MKQTTVKLYDENSHMRSFRAKVLSCEKDKESENFIIVLDRTAFFPEGGGQLSDTGKIGDAVVFDAQIKDGVIFHKADRALDVGITLDCEIDFETRFRRMQNHSGEHIISGLIHCEFGYDNVGFHMGHDNISIDFNGVLTEKDIKRIELLANRAVTENVRIICGYPDTEKLKTLEYRSKLELTENVRIVTVEGYDVCACCAPHVSVTGEIGIIKILSSEKNKGGTRLHILCGFDALEDYDARYRIIAETAQYLSVKQDELFAAVGRLNAEIDSLKQKNRALRDELLVLKTERIEPTDGNLFLFEDEITQMDQIHIMNEGAKKCKICAVFTKRSGELYTFVAGSKKVPMRTLIALLKEKLGAKCGGSDEMIQGSLVSSREEIIKFFEECDI